MTTGPIPPRLAALIRLRLGLPALAIDSPTQVDQREPPEKQKTTHPVRAQRLRQAMLTEPSQMSASEIVRELRRLRYDRANGRGRGRKEPLKCIAEQAGVHRMTLYRIIRDGQISENSRAALSRVLINQVRLPSLKRE
jgi:hypothetical protein